LIVKENAKSLLKDAPYLREELKPMLRWARYVVKCGNDLKFKKIYAPTFLKY